MFALFHMIVAYFAVRQCQISQSINATLFKTNCLRLEWRKLANSLLISCSSIGIKCLSELAVGELMSLVREHSLDSIAAPSIDILLGVLTVTFSLGNCLMTQSCCVEMIVSFSICSVKTPIF